MEETSAGRVGQQKEIDFVRKEQLAQLRECELPAVVAQDGKPVSGRSMKALLLAMDSRAGKSSTCWASVDTLALDAGLKRRTALRCLQGLRQLGLIIESPDQADRRIVHRRICHPNLAEFRATRESRTGATSNTGSLSATGATNAATSATNAATSATNARTGATSNTQRELKGKEETKRSSGDFRKMKPGEEWEPWKLRNSIDVADLVNPEQIEELWERLLIHERTRGKFSDSDDDRIRFWTFCHAVHRKRGKFIHPLIFFHQQLERGRSAISSDHVNDKEDCAWAVRELRKRYTPVLSGAGQGATPQPAAVDPRAVELREFEQLRADAARRLKEAGFV